MYTAALLDGAPPLDLCTKDKGNELRFINSSKGMSDFRGRTKKANARLVKCRDNHSLPVICVYASSAIAKGEEVLLNYGTRFPALPTGWSLFSVSKKDELAVENFVAVAADTPTDKFWLAIVTKILDNTLEVRWLQRALSTDLYYDFKKLDEISLDTIFCFGTRLPTVRDVNGVCVFYQCYDDLALFNA
eukprot:TRINITY_DN22021_c0_g1_i1.p1 TRINITY_DN22021_c0_g1~~TRINITY_DN22021_c0_g1_i1.p1  ORF type:complete len:189 (-),score=27.63 TRINITY_DN22021_c0_g1_i1:7-573(-)